MITIPLRQDSFDPLFDDRIAAHDDALNIPLTQFYDSHTGGSFSTTDGAVPEPSTWAMLLMGFIRLGAMIRRRAPGVSALAQ